MKAGARRDKLSRLRVSGRVPFRDPMQYNYLWSNLFPVQLLLIFKIDFTETHHEADGIG
jgi:hypothetical protein